MPFVTLLQQPPPAELSELRRQLADAIADLGGRVVPKLSWSCPKVGAARSFRQRPCHRAVYGCKQRNAACLRRRRQRRGRLRDGVRVRVSIRAAGTPPLIPTFTLTTHA